MEVRPLIVLSGGSHEFSSFRGVVENVIRTKDCSSENQSGFSARAGLKGINVS